MAAAPSPRIEPVGMAEAAQRFSRLAGLLTMGVGAAVAIAWFFHFEPILRMSADWPRMKFNTALGFAAAGGALWLLEDAVGAAAGWRTRVARALAFVPFAIGIVVVVEYTSGLDSGIGEWFVRDDGGNGAPGRPSPLTALAMVFASASLWMLRPGREAWVTQAQMFALAGAAITLLGLLSYLYGAQLIRSSIGYSSMALHTAVTFEVLFLGCLFRFAPSGPMRIFLDHGAAGIVARRLIPSMLLFAIFTGWLRLRAQRAGLIDTETGLVVMVTLLSVFVIVVTWKTAHMLSRTEAALRSSTDRLALALRSGNIAVWDWDLRTNQLTWDDQMYALYGVPPETPTVYSQWSSAVVPEDLELAESNVRRGIARKTVTDNAFRIRRPDGTVRHIAASQDVVLNDRGEVIKVVGVNRDVTELKEAEANLRVSEERMRLAFKSSAIGAAIVSLEGRFLSANTALCEMIGYAEGELQQLTFQSITHPDDLEGDLNFVRRLMDGEIASYDLEKRYLHKSGRVVWVRISVALVRDEARQPLHFVVQVEDVSGRRIAEQNALRARRELESFSYSVAHDLRAPLRAINGFGAMLQKSQSIASDPAAKESLQQIRDAAGRMGQLIDDLLSLSKVERYDLRRERVDVSLMSRQVIGALPPAPADRTVEFVVQDGMWADADPRLLKIALENLIGNAWKYSSRKPVARIEVGCMRHDAQTIFFVSDNGAGFDMAYAGKLFKPFQRLHAQSEFEGTGIGLATVQRIVERHGGTISADGRVGHGARFSFTLG